MKHGPKFGNMAEDSTESPQLSSHSRTYSCDSCPFTFQGVYIGDESH